MKKCLLLFIALALSACSGVFAQQEVQFGQHRVVPDQNVARSRGATTNALALIAPARGRVNVLMQFSRVPDAAALRRLERAGVVLEGYVGGNAYFAQIAPGRKPSDFAGLRATSVIGMRPEWKVSELLSPGRVPAWADRGNGRVAVTIRWFSNVDAGFVRSYVEGMGYEVIAVGPSVAAIEVAMPLSEVQRVAAEPWVCRVKPIDPPQELNNNYGRVLGAGCPLALPAELGGRGLTGKGVRVGLWDANVENHVDFGNRLHVLEFESSVQQSGGHGIHTAGTIAGAGLLNAKAQGFAPEAELYAMNFGKQSNGLLVAEEMEDVYLKYNIALTSNSYGLPLGRLCKYYDQLSYSFVGAFNMDLLSEWYPEMTHVFAAGNEQGQCDKKYGSSTARSKNVIYVGAVDANGTMSSFSSWGPMDDGRLIPTVSAKGVSTLSTVADNGYDFMDGTSMACPTVSGIATLLTERYHQLHGGQHMNSALVKGILANTADDRGNVGPDFQYGYGVVNASAAVKVIERGWYKNDTVVNGSAAAPFKISVPAGVKRLRVMLTWTDPAVDKEYPYGEPVLINDLDLSVSAGGTTALPWVLDPAHPESKATTGIDMINNIEQVVVDHPAAGDAIVTVGGHDKIKDGEKQGYALTWYFEYGEPVLLSPVGGELFSPGEKILLRADNLEGATTAEISYDGGKSYRYMGKVKSLYATFMSIPKDAKSTRDAKIRLIDSKGSVLVNAHPFIIAGQPQNLKSSATPCALGSWKLTWSAVEGATKYAVMRADVPTGTWKEIAELSATEYAVPLDQIEIGGRNVYAVAVKTAQGQYGPRSLGVLVAEPTPMTLAAKDLPYKETFVTLPLLGGTLEAGVSLNMQYAETPASVGLPLGSRMVAVRVSLGSNKKLFEDPANVFTIRLCKVDLRGVPAGTHLVLRAMGLMTKPTKADGAQMRLMANGKLVKLTTGQDTYAATGGLAEMCWDLRDFAGQEDVQLELQYACHEKGTMLILLGYTLFEALRDPEVGVFVSKNAVAPKVNMGVEKVRVQVFSGSEKAVASVPVVVLLDGRVAASAVVKDLKPYEEREITIPVDFSTAEAEGHIFKVEVRASVEGDRRPRNNSARIEVYNMGTIYAHPVTVMQETLFGVLPDDPKAEVQVDGVVVYADMGGLLRGYSGLQMASVHFIPKNPAKTVQITFSEWGFGEGDKLELYAGDLKTPFVYKGAKVSRIVEGTSDGAPLTILSRAKDGGVYVMFHADRGGDASAKRGWKAIVREVPRMNYLTLEPITVASQYPEGEAEIKIKVRNLTGVQQTKVDGVMKVEGEKQPVRFEIPLIAANQELEFTIPSKARVPYPWWGTISVAVYGSDTDLSDNEQKVTIRNDKFWYGGKVKDEKKQGLLKAEVAPSRVNFLGVTNEAELTYNMDKTLLFFTETVNPLHVQLQKEVKAEDLPAMIHVWIDLDESDNELKNAAPEYYSVPLEKGKLEYAISVDLKGQKAGKRRMRIAVLPGGEAERDRFIKGETLAWGRAADITAEIKEGENPSVNDLGLRLFAQIASGANLGEQEVKVTIENHGHTAASNFEIKLLVNGDEKIEETVTQTVPPFEGSIQYTFSKKVDLSEGGKEYRLEVQLPEDGVMENNKVEQTVVSLPAQAKDKLYALDFKGVKGESVDYSSLQFDYTSEATLEGWFYLRKPQKALLFKSEGLLVLSTANSGDLPHNAVVVVLGGNQLDATEAGALKPGQFHHVAITFKSQGYFLWKSTEVKVFIDGKAVTMNKRVGGFEANFVKLAQAVRLDGQIKMLRVWDKVRKESDIAAQMDKSIRDVATGALPRGCIAEYMMNEGSFGYIASGSDLAKLASERVDSKDENIWVNLADRLVGGVNFEGQVVPSKIEKDGTISFLMPHSHDATQPLKGQIETLWPGTKLEYNGSDVTADTQFKFNNADKTIALKASVTVFGIAMQQDVKVRLVLDKQDETKIVKVNLLAGDNKGVKNDIRVENPDQSIRLTGLEEETPGAFADVSKCVLSFEELSPAARVHYKDKSVAQGGKLEVDLTGPAMLKVVAENGRNFQLYTVQIVKPQTIQWETSELSYTFTAESMPMDAASSVKGMPVVYRSKDENVVTVDGEGNLRTSGVGETEIVALAEATGVYAAAVPVGRKVKVTPAALTVRPKAMEMETGGKVPTVELGFEGLLFNEKTQMFKPIEYAIYKDATTVWTPALGSLGEGEYEVKPMKYTAPYADGNYIVTLANGKLVVKPSLVNRLVTFEVVEANGGAALQGAKVEIHGTKLVTGSDGKVRIALAPESYDYSVALDGYAASRGVVKVEDANLELKVELKKLEVMLTYTTDGNGVIGLGAAKQRLPKGGTGEKVLAVPNLGYRFSKWEDGVTEDARQDQDVQADVTHTASFEPITYMVEYAVAEGGEFADGTTAKKTQKVIPGQSSDGVEVQAKAGYYFAGWSDGIATPKRKDTPTGDYSVEAQFYQAFTLPLVEDFEASVKLPYAWRVENYSTSKKYALWKVGKNSKYNTKTGRCAYVNCDDGKPSSKHNTGLLTPWITIANLNEDVTIEFDLLLAALSTPAVKATLEYRTEENGAWSELASYVKDNAVQKIKATLDKGKISGKEYVQFRWHYIEAWGFGIAVDNISIGVVGKATIVYKAGEGGKVTVKPDDPSAAAKEVRVTTASGTLGEEVTAVPDDGYLFDRWEDLNKEAARRDSKNGRHTAYFTKKESVFTLAYSSELEGSLQGLNYQKVKEKGDGAPVTAVANEGYRFVKWSDNVTMNPRVDVAVVKDIAVTASYVKVFKLEVKSVLEDGSVFADGGATVTDATTRDVLQKVCAGQRMRVEAKRVKGYVGSVAVAGATQDADGVYVVEGDVTVTVTYTLQSAKATLTFVMKDAEGLVEGVQVALDGVANPQKTDAKGVARFEGLQLKAYSYTASKEGYKDAKGVVKLEGDATQEVTLERVATLTFVVKGEDGVALQGAEVVVDGKKQFTDANGKAAYPGLALAEYSYTVSKAGYEAAEGKKVLEAQGTTVEVLLKRVSSPKPEPDAVESVLLSVVTLRPNPASAVLQVERAAAVETLKVVTLRGEMLLEQRNLAAASEVVVRLDGVPDGMYLLVVEGDGAQRAIPFVVTK